MIEINLIQRKEETKGEKKLSSKWGLPSEKLHQIETLEKFWERGSQRGKVPLQTSREKEMKRKLDQRSPKERGW